MSRPMTEHVLREENQAFAGTGGISANAKAAKLLHAFQDIETGRTEIARMANGSPAALHLIIGLPDEWVVARNRCGHISAIKNTIVAGFLRNDVFYTRAQAAALLA